MVVDCISNNPVLATVNVSIDGRTPTAVEQQAGRVRIEPVARFVGAKG